MIYDDLSRQQLAQDIQQLQQRAEATGKENHNRVQQYGLRTLPNAGQELVMMGDMLLSSDSDIMMNDDVMISY